VRARDLAVEYETVGLDSDAMDAARRMAEHRLPALLVVDERGTPKAILPASQMVKILVPMYVVEDPTHAAVVDERHADRLCQALKGRKVRDCQSKTVPAPPFAGLASAGTASRRHVLTGGVRCCPGCDPGGCRTRLAVPGSRRCAWGPRPHSPRTVKEASRTCKVPSGVPGSLVGE